MKGKERERKKKVQRYFTRRRESSTRKTWRLSAARDINDGRFSKMFESVATQAESALKLLQTDEVSSRRAPGLSKRNIAILKELTNTGIVDGWLQASNMA